MKIKHNTSYGSNSAREQRSKKGFGKTQKNFRKY